MKKSTQPQPLTRSEKKAAEVDRWVKQHVAERRVADAAKKSRLKGLRMAREAERENDTAPPDSPTGTEESTSDE